MTIHKGSVRLYDEPTPNQGIRGAWRCSCGSGGTSRDPEDALQRHLATTADYDAPTVEGECLCHGIIVTGTAGTIAQPDPYWHQDFWTGKRIKCVAVLVPGQAQPHDIPVKGMRVIPPGESQ